MSLKNFHVFTLLICCAVNVGLLPVFQENLLVPPSRTKCQRRWQKPKILNDKMFDLSIAHIVQQLHWNITIQHILRAHLRLHSGKPTTTPCV